MNILAVELWFEEPPDGDLQWDAVGAFGEWRYSVVGTSPLDPKRPIPMVVNERVPTKGVHYMLGARSQPWQILRLVPEVASLGDDIVTGWLHAVALRTGRPTVHNFTLQSVGKAGA